MSIREFCTRFFRSAVVLTTLAAASSLFASAPHVPSLGWVRLTPSAYPSVRAAFAMAYDPVSRSIVLFGGYNPTLYLNETWTFDGATWTQINPPVAPSPRAGAMLAYDSQTRQLVLFGGYDGVQFLGDTWLWNGATSTWTRATPANSPPPMTGTMLFTDPLTGRASLFGGSGVANNIRFFSSDTWRWTGTNWKKLSLATSPSARDSGVVGFDPARKQVVISGGISELNTEDTWTWDGRDWTQQFPATQMPYVFYSSAAYDPILRKVIVFGGDEATGAENATWAWTGSDWVHLQTRPYPSRRDSMGMAYDFTSHQLIMFGGSGLNRLLNGTWKLIRH